MRSVKILYLYRQSLIQATAIALLSVTLLLQGANAFAKGDTPESIAKVAATQFEDWLKMHKIKRGAIAVTYQGKLMATGGRNRTADEAAPIASLSKAITAVCTVKALEQANKTPDVTLEKLMPALLSKIKLTDTRLKKITIAQLLTHNSGIHSQFHRKFILRLKNLAKQQKRQQLEKIATEKLTTEPGAGYHYSNANYLILGIVIEELTGQKYTDYCQATVLAPIGITSATLYQPWQVMSSWGGWSISATDYARFLDTYFPDNTVMGSDPYETGMLTKIGGGAYYNLGMLMRATDDGFNFWHTGAWHWKGNGRNDRFGAYAATYDNGYTVSANYAHDAFEDGQYRELDTLLYNATHPAPR